MQIFLNSRIFLLMPLLLFGCMSLTQCREVNIINSQGVLEKVPENAPLLKHCSQEDLNLIAATYERNFVAFLRAMRKGGRTSAAGCQALKIAAHQGVFNIVHCIALCNPMSFNTFALDALHIAINQNQTLIALYLYEKVGLSVLSCEYLEKLDALAQQFPQGPIMELMLADFPHLEPALFNRPCESNFQ